MEEKVKEILEKIEILKTNPNPSLEEINKLEEELGIILEIANNYIQNILK